MWQTCLTAIPVCTRRQRLLVPCSIGVVHINWFSFNASIIVSTRMRTNNKDIILSTNNTVLPVFHKSTNQMCLFAIHWSIKYSNRNQTKQTESIHSSVTISYTYMYQRQGFTLGPTYLGALSSTSRWLLVELPCNVTWYIGLCWYVWG